MASKLGNWAMMSVVLVLLCGAFGSYAAPDAGLRGPDAWKSMDAGGLLVKAIELARNKAAIVLEREALAVYVAERFFKDGVTTRSVGCKKWEGFVGAFKGDFDADERTLWEGKLHDAFADSEARIARLSGADFESLAGALTVLKSRKVPGLAATWVTKTEHWKSLEFMNFVRLAGLVTDSDSAEALGRINGHIKDKYLVSNEAIRSVEVGHWQILATNVGRHLSLKDRVFWGTKLCGAFASTPQALSQLKPDDFVQLAYGLWLMHHPSTKTFLSKVFSHRETCSRLSVDQMRQLAFFGAEVGMAVPRQVMEEIEKQTLAQDAKTPLAWRQAAWMCMSWRGARDEAKARAWAVKAYRRALGTAEARAKLDADAIGNLSNMMLTPGLTGKGKGYPEFATVLAEMVKNGKLPGGLRKYPHRHRGLAAPLGTAQARQIVRAELLDPEGVVRLEAAKILSWAYSVAGEADAWKTYLDGRIAASAADKKAYWFFARAHAESVVGNRRFPFKGKELLDQALATAASASCRSAVLSEVAYCYRSTLKFQEGEKFFDSAANRFPDAQTLAIIRSLRNELRQRGIQYLRNEARTMGARAQYMETEAQEAAVKGDKTSSNHYLRLARFYREHQRQLLLRAGQ